MTRVFSTPTWQTPSSGQNLPFSASATPLTMSRPNRRRRGRYAHSSNRSNGLSSDPFQLNLNNHSSSSTSNITPLSKEALASKNITSLLRKRRQGTNQSRHSSISRVSQWVESLAASSPSWNSVRLPDDTRSTISLCFSPDGSTFASSHGDHTVKIVNSYTGKVQHVLVGHPRTPWTVKFHPTDSNSVASGCLAGQVFIWDIKQEQIRWRVFQERPIISLAFHPTGDVLGIASGKNLYMWRYTIEPHADIAMTVETSLRAVVFPSKGTSIIVGIANATNEVPVELANQDEPTSMKQTMQIVEFPITSLLYEDGEAQLLATRTQRWRQAVKDQQLLYQQQRSVIVKHAILYNDGGMDISSNGNRFICCMYQPPSASPIHSLAQDINTNKSSVAQSPRSTTSMGVPPPPSVTLPPPATLMPPGDGGGDGGGGGGGEDEGGTKQGTGADWANHHTTTSSSASASSTAYSQQQMQQTPSGHRPVAHNRNIRHQPKYDSTTGRRIKRRRPPPVPLFQVAIVGLEPHNYGHTLAYHTVRWKTAKGTTSVKFSPSSKYILVGYGVRAGGLAVGGAVQFDVVVSMYRTFVNQIVPVQSIESCEDDLNIALFHPQIGGGFVFGTKRGSIRRIGIDRHSNRMIVAPPSSIGGDGAIDGEGDTTMESNPQQEEPAEDRSYRFC